MRSRPIKILRLPEVRARTGESTSTIYAGIAKGTFPKQVPLGPNLVGWIEEEIDNYLESRVAERDAKILKDLKGDPTTDDERGAVARETCSSMSRRRSRGRCG
jgi:prophage regulatory protein